MLIDTPFSTRERCSPDHTATDIAGAVDWILEAAAGPVTGRAA